MATQAHNSSAVQRIREFHSLGLKHKQRWKASSRGRRTTELRSIAARLSVSEDYLRKAIRFADPERGYSQEELDELCRQVAARGVQFGVSFVMELLSIPRESGQRTQLQGKAIDEGWSLKELKLTTASLHLRRPGSGRRQQIAKDKSGVLIQLRQVTERWLRFAAQVVDSTSKRRPYALPPRLLKKTIVAKRSLEEVFSETYNELTDTASK